MLKPEISKEEAKKKFRLDSIQQESKSIDSIDMKSEVVDKVDAQSSKAQSLEKDDFSN